MSLTPRALAALAAHAWPGNVRELRNAIERAAVLSATGRLDVEDFPLASPAGGNGRSTNGVYLPIAGGYELKPQIEQLERATIVRALEASKGSRREAAHLLGVSLRTLFYKLRRYRLE